ALNHSELQRGAAGAAAGLDVAISHLGPFARFKARVAIVNLTGTQHLSVDISIQTIRHFDIQIAHRQLDLQTGAAPASSRQIDVDGAACNRYRDSAAGQRQLRIGLPARELDRTFDSGKLDHAITRVNLQV